MDTLKFSTNWNNKLNCKCFTTVRLYDPNRHFQYKDFIVELKKGNIYEKIGIFKVMDIATGLLSEIPSHICYLDTGYGKVEFIKIFENMYKNSSIDIHNATLCVMVLSKQSF